ncbi:MAG: flippase [Deltaproteobacteria bacterium]|nr:flippase [Deltaproteobacteria bacterium]
MSEGASQAHADAAEVAQGSGVVLGANLINRAVRLVNNWFLAGALGPLAYGLYELARTVVTILASFAPLGTDKGVVLYGARYDAAKDAAGLKGTAVATLAVSLGAGLALTALCAVGLTLFDADAHTPGLSRAMWLCLPAVPIWSLLLGVVGLLRGLKDMRGQSIAYLVVLPVGMMLTSLAAVALGWGLDGVILGFVASNALALLMALRVAWRRLRPTWRQPAPPRLEWGTLLRFSVPEGVSSTLFRLNQWTDTLMVAAMAGAADLGLYRVAVSLAMVGELPGVAINTMFQPVVAALFVEQDQARLNAVVRTVTRWLILLAAPVYLPVIIAQDLIIAVYDDAYAGAASSLALLMAGQAVFVVCTPVAALIPMSGRSRLNLINGLAAAALNVGLNALLIPRFGVMGASAATATSLILWSVARVVQVKYLLGCQAFTARSLGLGAVVVGLAVGGRLWAQELGLWAQGAVAVGATLVFVAVAARFGVEAGDEALVGPAWGRVKKKLGRLGGRLGR